jgi:hypothetical protein
MTELIHHNEPLIRMVFLVGVPIMMAACEAAALRRRRSTGAQLAGRSDASG